LFYFSRSISSAGKPNKTCIGSLKDDMNNEFMGLGAMTLISGILLLFVFIFQYCLWGKYD